jgi:alcohol dehydrogenase
MAMRAIELTAPREFRRIETPQPDSPGPGEALVRSHVMGICGTDVSCYLGKFPFFDYPRIPGHELGVEVLAIGGEVDNVAVGDRCSVEPYMHCGHCYACRRGATNCCVNLRVVGVMMNGGLCDQFLIRADKLHPSATLGFQQLSLVETLAIGYHATQRGGPKSADRVLIIGAGPIGLATLEFTRLSGAEVTVMDLSASRLEFCSARDGVRHTVRYTDRETCREALLDITGGDMFQVVTDATGNPESMSAALEYVAPTGTLVYVGITNGQLTFPHKTMHRPEMTIKASRNALANDFREIIRLIEQGTVNTDSWVTHQTTFNRLIDDFPGFIAPDSGVVKAVIQIQ